MAAQDLYQGAQDVDFQLRLSGKKLYDTIVNCIPALIRKARDQRANLEQLGLTRRDQLSYLVQLDSDFWKVEANQKDYDMTITDAKNDLDDLQYLNSHIDNEMRKAMNGMRTVGRLYKKLHDPEFTSRIDIVKRGGEEINEVVENFYQQNARLVAAEGACRKEQFLERAAQLIPQSSTKGNLQHCACCPCFRYHNNATGMETPPRDEEAGGEGRHHEQSCSAPSADHSHPKGGSENQTKSSSPSNGACSDTSASSKDTDEQATRYSDELTPRDSDEPTIRDTEEPTPRDTEEPTPRDTDKAISRDTVEQTPGLKNTFQSFPSLSHPAEQFFEPSAIPGDAGKSTAESQHFPQPRPTLIKSTEETVRPPPSSIHTNEEPTDSHGVVVSDSQDIDTSGSQSDAVSDSPNLIVPNSPNINMSDSSNLESSNSPNVVLSNSPNVDMSDLQNVEPDSANIDMSDSPILEPDSQNIEMSESQKVELSDSPNIDMSDSQNVVSGAENIDMSDSQNAVSDAENVDMSDSQNAVSDAENIDMSDSQNIEPDSPNVEMSNHQSFELSDAPNFEMSDSQNAESVSHQVPCKAALTANVKQCGEIPGRPTSDLPGPSPFSTVGRSGSLLSPSPIIVPAAKVSRLSSISQNPPSSPRERANDPTISLGALSGLSINDETENATDNRPRFNNYNNVPYRPVRHRNLLQPTAARPKTPKPPSSQGRSETSKLLASLMSNSGRSSGVPGNEKKILPSGQSAPSHSPQVTSSEPAQASGSLAHQSPIPQHDQSSGRDDVTHSGFGPDEMEPGRQEQPASSPSQEPASSEASQTLGNIARQASIRLHNQSARGNRIARSGPGVGSLTLRDTNTPSPPHPTVRPPLYNQPSAARPILKPHLKKSEGVNSQKSHPAVPATQATTSSNQSPGAPSITSQNSLSTPPRIGHPSLTPTTPITTTPPTPRPSPIRQEDLLKPPPNPRLHLPTRRNPRMRIRGLPPGEHPSPNPRLTPHIIISPPAPDVPAYPPSMRVDPGHNQSTSDEVRSAASSARDRPLEAGTGSGRRTTALTSPPEGGAGVMMMMREGDVTGGRGGGEEGSRAQGVGGGATGGQAPGGGQTSAGDGGSSPSGSGIQIPGLSVRAPPF
ncbi:MAG: hypothetical protein Q9227_003697 [Pyrenula ochraceoflavens]